MSSTVDINEVHKETFRLCQVMAQHMFEVNKQSVGFQFPGSMVSRAAARTIRDYLMVDDEVSVELRVEALQSAILSTPATHLILLYGAINNGTLKEYGLTAKSEQEKSVNRCYVLFLQWAKNLVEEMQPILQDVVNSQSPEPTPPKSRRTP